MEQYVKLNSPGHNDGTLVVWMDGEEVLRLGDVNYRSVDNDAGRIGGIFVSTFHGGNTPDWGPSRTSFARFDSFVAARERIGPASPESNK
jgi:hypothetical protein